MPHLPPLVLRSTDRNGLTMADIFAECVVAFVPSSSLAPSLISHVGNPNHFTWDDLNADL